MKNSAFHKNFQVFWDKKNNVPIILNKEINEIKYYDNLSYIASDLRPVFLEEKHFLRSLFNNIFDDSLYYDSVWIDKGSRYVINGKKKTLKIVDIKKRLNEINAEDITNFQASEEMLEKERYIFNKFIDLNKDHFQFLMNSPQIDDEGHVRGAIPFTNNIVERYLRREPVVSFSGGKDSTVVSHIVRKALNKDSILHIFGDTTLENKNTYKYVESFKVDNPHTPFWIEKNDNSNFMDLCKKIGPPSRVKSWCCSVFKTGPMGTTLSEIDKNILTFYGIRRAESSARSKYKKVTQSPKIKSQIVVSPIIDWLDIDIWLYILTERVSFNDAYRYGFSRVGCWCCPNNSDRSDIFTSIYYSENYSEWNNFLIEFAKSIGKKDAEVYVQDGKWKARQGGTGLDLATNRVTSNDCTTEDNAKNYYLTSTINELFFELLKPFGKLNFAIGNDDIGEIFIMGKNNTPIIKILAKKGDTKCRFTVLTDLTNEYPQKTNINNTIFGYFENQLRKFNFCIYCKGCNSVCPVDAIKVTDKSYYINENLCVNCLKCVNHYAQGCLIARALDIKKEVNQI